MATIAGVRQTAQRPSGLGSPALLIRTSGHFEQRYLGNGYLQSASKKRIDSAPAAISTGVYAHDSGPSAAKGPACCPGRVGKAGSVQAKPIIGSPDDVYEQEADRVARQIMRIPDSSVQTAADAFSDRLTIRRMAQNGGGGHNAAADIALGRHGGQSLSAATRGFMEPRFGADFGDVRLHSDYEAHQAAAQVQAKAFTYGHHIWLGRGADEGDRSLMAHELTHVVQQGAARFGSSASQSVNRLPLQPRIQRDRRPAADACPGGVRNVDLFAVNLPGASKSIYDDLARTNTIWAQCCIRINLTGGESWKTDLLDMDTPNGVLNEDASPTVDTDEVQTMTAHRPGGDGLHVYYVPSNTLRDRGGSYGYTGMHASLPPSVSITNISAVDTLAHELGHVLLNDRGHHADPDNLMASGSIRNVGVDQLEPAQCGRI